MRRVGWIAAVVCLLGACLSSPPDANDGSDELDAASLDGPPPPGDGGMPLPLVEEMVVLADCTIVTSLKSLAEGIPYTLVAGGTATLGPVLEADAEYFWDRTEPEDVFDGTGEVDMGLAVDDLVIDEDRTPAWGPYRSGHDYEVEFIGKGAPINVQFHDSGCANNEGELSVTILGPPE